MPPLELDQALGLNGRAEKVCEAARLLREETQQLLAAAQTYLAVVRARKPE